VPGSLKIRGGTTSWATLDLGDIEGVGRLSPRLLVRFAARPLAHSKVVLADVTLRLEHGQELIGEGRIVEERVEYDGAQIMFEVPTSARLLRHVTDSLGPASSAVELTARLHGLARTWLDPAAPIGQKMAGDPEPGTWEPLTLTSGYPETLTVPRANWFGQVLAPTRNEQYRYIELALPRSDQMLTVEWANAVSHLDRAEAAYATGDDPAVFSHLRGALDALPGAKKHVLDGVADSNKRSRLDALLNDAGEFLHTGRHVAKLGEQAGSFPVTHVDAAFALDLLRVLLSHMSLLLVADSA